MPERDQVALPEQVALPDFKFDEFVRSLVAPKFGADISPRTVLGSGMTGVAFLEPPDAVLASTRVRASFPAKPDTLPATEASVGSCRTTGGSGHWPTGSA